MIAGENMKKVGLISASCVLIDQITKLIITSKIELNKSVILIDNFFNLTYVRNDGAAWSILSGNRIFLILISVATIFLIYKYFIKDKKIQKIETLTYGLLLGGITGNLIDRLIRGYVIDFFDFLIFGYNFPIFNFADIFIVVSVFLIIVETFRREEHEVRS